MNLKLLHKNLRFLCSVISFSCVTTENRIFLAILPIGSDFVSIIIKTKKFLIAPKLNRLIRMCYCIPSSNKNLFTLNFF